MLIFVFTSYLKSASEWKRLNILLGIFHKQKMHFLCSKNKDENTSPIKNCSSSLTRSTGKIQWLGTLADHNLKHCSNPLNKAAQTRIIVQTEE